MPDCGSIPLYSQQRGIHLTGTGFEIDGPKPQLLGEKERCQSRVDCISLCRTFCRICICQMTCFIRGLLKQSSISVDHPKILPVFLEPGGKDSVFPVHQWEPPPFPYCPVPEVQEGLIAYFWGLQLFLELSVNHPGYNLPAFYGGPLITWVISLIELAAHPHNRRPSEL